MARDFSFADALDIVISNFRIVALIVAVFTLSGVFLALLLPEKYFSETVITPNQSGSQVPGLAAVSRQLGGLASLIGGSTGIEGDQEFYYAVLTSRSLAEKFIDENTLMPLLFSDEWDTTTGSWDVDDESLIPTKWSALQEFRDSLLVVQRDRVTGLITVGFEWEDPAVAARWANEYVALANRQLQSSAIDEAHANINFLQEKVDETGLVELKQSIYELIQMQIESVMSAQGNDQFAFRIIDYAMVPDDPAKPRKFLIIAVMILLGGFAGGSFPIVRYVLSSD